MGVDNASRRFVVVTGGGSGIGAGCAERFAEQGDEVIVADITQLEHPVDVTDETSVESFFEGLPRAPDVLVNAAGIGLGRRILELDFALWRQVLAVNLDGAFLCLRAAARRMVEAGGGVIVNITSVNDRMPMDSHGPYCVSKAGLSMLTRIAALELGRFGIRVVGVAPGTIDTPLVAKTMRDPAVRSAFEDRTPLGGSMGTPADVAGVVAFLASDAARWITGDIVAVDGGQLQLGFPDVAAILGGRKHRAPQAPQ